MRRLYQTALLAFVTLVASACQSGPAHAESFDSRELQKTFGRAKSLQLINRVSDIPADGQQMLVALTEGGMLSATTEPLADIGMDWSSGDAKIAGLPWGQHLFSAMSGELIAVLFVTGGQEVRFNLLLAPRNSTDFCWFRIPPLHSSNLRLSVVQNFVRPDRDQTISKTPDCHLMSGLKQRDQPDKERGLTD